MFRVITLIITALAIAMLVAGRIYFGLVSFFGICESNFVQCRAERRKEQVCSKQTYDAVWAKLASLPRTVEHIVVQLGIPIAYPRMNFME